MAKKKRKTKVDVLLHASSNNPFVLLTEPLGYNQGVRSEVLLHGSSNDALVLLIQPLGYNQCVRSDVLLHGYIAKGIVKQLELLVRTCLESQTLDNVVKVRDVMNQYKVIRESGPGYEYLHC